MSKMGRPKKYTKKLSDEILKRLAEGQSLRKICRSDGMPDRATVHKWIIENIDDFFGQYARAREIGLDEIADETLEIADDGTNDTYTDDEGNVRADYDVIHRSRLRVDTRKWYLSKLARVKYGDDGVNKKDDDDTDGKVVVEIVGGFRNRPK